MSCSHRVAPFLQAHFSRHRAVTTPPRPDTVVDPLKTSNHLDKNGTRRFGTPTSRRVPELTHLLSCSRPLFAPQPTIMSGDNGIAVGLKRGFIVTKRTKVSRPSNRKGVSKLVWISECAVHMRTDSDLPLWLVLAETRCPCEAHPRGCA